MNNDTHNTHTGALEQYRNLLTQYADTVRAHTAPAIAPQAAEAARTLLSAHMQPLPRKGTPGYRYTDLDAMLAPDLGVNITRVQATTDTSHLFRCTIPSVSPLNIVTVNDSCQDLSAVREKLPEGLDIVPFSMATEAQQAIIRSHYGKTASASTDTPAVTLNTALAQDGLLIHVKAGHRISKPLQLINILQPGTDAAGNTYPVLATRRLLVVMEQDAQLQVLVCDHDRNADSVSASTRVVEMYVGTGARLDWYELEETSGHTSRYLATAAHMEDNATLNLFGATLKSGHSRNDITVHINGSHCELAIDGMAIADSEQSVDNSAVVHHHKPLSTSRQTFKYLIGDNARGAFEGLIKVDHGAYRTEAYQTDRNLLASPGARMHTQPQLEIYCDDVKCSHGAATGQLDSRAMFYMRSRGIPEKEARAMLMNAFMADVIDKVNLEPLRDRLKHLVERRLTGDNALCQGCKL